MKLRIILAVIIVIALVVFIFTNVITGYFSQKVFVERVIDGDTIELQNGEKVRLLGMDTPERGQYFYKESTDFLKNLIEGEIVTILRDETNKDKYGRLLRYVYFGNIFVNLELVEQGFAKSLIIEPDVLHSDIILDAEAKASDANLGVWKFSPDFFCIGIHYLHYNAKGNDNENINDEYVSLRNKCIYPVDMTGFLLSDSSNKTYGFPVFVLQNKTIVTIHTGPGIDNATDLYWNNRRAIWNNDGDTLLMWNKDGELILDYSYSW